MPHNMDSANGMGHHYQLSHLHYGHQPQNLSCVWQPFPGHNMLVDLPVCSADGCENRVHFEYFLPPSMQIFEYCSPVCRDKCLLEIHQQQLEYDVETLKKNLQCSVLSDKSRSSELSHNQQSNYCQVQPVVSSVDTPTPHDCNSDSGMFNAVILEYV